MRQRFRAFHTRFHDDMYILECRSSIWIFFSFFIPVLVHRCIVKDVSCMCHGEHQKLWLKLVLGSPTRESLEFESLGLTSVDTTPT